MSRCSGNDPLLGWYGRNFGDAVKQRDDDERLKEYVRVMMLEMLAQQNLEQEEHDALVGNTHVIDSD